MIPPLAERLRPKDLNTYIGQSHLVAEGKPIRLQIETGNVPSLILWGPPGTGKTTLAQIISETSNRPFYKLSAINAGVKEVRQVIDQAKKNDGLFTSKNPILFIDEIHRFSKSQQDSLLEAVEKGWVTLIGATTENPSFEVISALLSRCQVYILKSLNKEELESLLHYAITKDELLGKENIEILETEALIRLSGGDARKLLNVFELVLNQIQGSPKVITNQLINDQIQNRSVRYDKTGEQHYDIISAFIKSIRGSDPNAAVYYLARMIEGGEDLKFIARRLVVLASEDIGNANPTALIMANNTFQAVTFIGHPESRIILSQCVIYLACSVKSNASYSAINKAQQLVRETGDLEVPLPLRNAPTALMKELGYGGQYKYAHDHEGNFVDQEFLPEELSNTRIFDPGNNPREIAQRQHLQKLWKKKYGY